MTFKNSRYAKALLSAFLLWLAWPPMPYTALLLLIGFIPLLSVVEDILQWDGQKKGKQVFGITFLSFFVWNTACIYWVFNAMDAVMPTWVALLISLIPFGLAAVLMALAFWLYYRLRRVTGKVTSYIGLVCFWIGYEYLHQSWDLAFPWMNLGNGLAQFHQLAQWYSITGVYGGTLWILLVNILLYEALLSPRKTWKRFIAPVALIIIPAGISLAMYFSYREKEDPSNVVVVQPNVDPYEKFGHLSTAEQVQNLIRLSDSVAQVNTEYFIWPETAIPQYTDEDKIRYDLNFRTVQNFLQQYKNGNVISGISSYTLYNTAKTLTANFDANSGMYYDSFNAAIQIENSAHVDFYHKSKLVPGVEQLPFAKALAFLKPVFAGFGGTTGSYGSQPEPSVFFAQSGIGAAPVICYESIWGAYVAQYVSKGAQFIAIITNDGWWGNTSGKDQHLEYAKLRAIETRRWVARSANTGISAFINQRGDIVQRTKWWTAKALKQDINLNEELTFYVKFGDYIAFAGCLGCGLFAALLLLNVRKRSFKW
ncbi:apolipoprotein N-acyltransferase (plasmid) [Pedobacter sp. BS3]|uniref:apolipoprotein N-acyltransferase n=1 Tax=Pedobacter sp. BS3 TaxID=2567937 RepID=UPI0011EEA01E|nr:apolipoprotein N-acyltransferase [Pedobacter sp. BS3]TZF86180.1 apolipoprotein N-acyltransferase [Pedobacter sp. BS3]